MRKGVKQFVDSNELSRAIYIPIHNGEIIINNSRFHSNGSFKLENITVIEVNLKYYKDIEDNKCEIIISKKLCTTI